MITSPSLMAPATGEFACTSQGFAPFVALARNAMPPGTSALMYLAFGLSGWKYQLPFVLVLIILLARSSSANATDASARPAHSALRIVISSPCPRRRGSLLKSAAQILAEESERAAPRERRRLLVVSRLARVVVEPVVRTRIHVHLVRYVLGIERLGEVGDARVDALVVAGVVQLHGTPEPFDVLGRKLFAIEGDGAIDADGLDGRTQRETAAIAEADDTELAVAVRVGREP